MTELPIPPPPTRAEVEERWLALAEGRLTREDVHEWSVQWVEHDVTFDDPRVWDGLVDLHGFDLTYRKEWPSLVKHGPPGPYLHSRERIAAELARWRARCVEYDADPDGFRIRTLERVAAELTDSTGHAERQARARILARLADLRGRPRPQRRDG